MLWRIPLLVSALAVLLIGGSTSALSADAKSGVTVDSTKKTVTVAAKVAPRKLAHLAEVYPIEVIAAWPHPKGKKAHETVLTIDANPSEVSKALESLGLKPGKPAKGEGTAAEGPEVNLYIEIPQADGTVKRVTLDKVLVDPKTKKPMPKGVKFKFTGSVLSQAAPDKPEKVFGADISGTLISVFPVTDETVLQSSLTMKEEKYLKLDVNKTALPAEGSPVNLVLEVIAK